VTAVTMGLRRSCGGMFEQQTVLTPPSSCPGVSRNPQEMLGAPVQPGGADGLCTMG